MRFELLMAVVMIPLNGCFLDGLVHAFDLAVDTWVFNLGEPMFDAVPAAAHVEHVGHVRCRWSISVSRRKGELDIVVGQNRMDFIMNGPDEGFQEGRR